MVESGTIHKSLHNIQILANLYKLAYNIARKMNIRHYIDLIP